MFPQLLKIVLFLWYLDNIISTILARMKRTVEKKMSTFIVLVGPNFLARWN